MTHLHHQLDSNERLDRAAYQRFHDAAWKAGWRTHEPAEEAPCAICYCIIGAGAQNAYTRPADERPTSADNLTGGQAFHYHPLVAHTTCLRNVFKLFRVVPKP